MEVVAWAQVSVRISKLGLIPPTKTIQTHLAMMASVHHDAAQQ